ncbi:S24 family peptidase [Thermomonas sp.]|uniref:LexA family protein n=1 Tax=Thermomonas sp. TaxID=1971895 RepID=UPI002CD82EBD|nr:S24 family peptidase [Thermomonas sp.]HRO62638.1 S24 family peptidase [Thermomonas sp.]
MTALPRLAAADTQALALAPLRLTPVPLLLPLAAARAALGFPSPAEDFQDDGIDLNELLVRNPPATFLYRAEGWSMLHAGICDGDILLVDRSVTPQDGDVVIATWDGNAPTCKVLHVCRDHLELHSRNPHVPHIVLPPGTEAEVFAVVGVVRQMRRSHGRVGR